MKHFNKFLSFIMATVLLITPVSILSSGAFFTEGDLKKISYVCVQKVFKPTFGPTETTTYTHDSKGNVTKATIKTGSDVDSSSYTYDSKGNITKKTYTSTDGATGSTTTTYNTDGNLSKYVQTLKSSGSTYTTTVTLTYDNAGRITKKVEKTSGLGRTDTTSYTYNSKGNITKEVLKSDHDYGYSSTATIVSTYDSKDRLIKQTHTTKSTNYSSTDTTTYTFNDKGLLTKEVYSAPSSDVLLTTIYSYNSKSELIKEDRLSDYGEDGSYRTIATYSIGSNGKVSKIVYDNSSSKETVTYTYNSNGDVTKEVSKYTSDNESSVTTITYTYDTNGNLTKESVKYTDTYGESSTSSTTYKYEKISATRYEKGDISFVYNNKIELKDGSAKPSVIVRNNNTVIEDCPALKKNVDYKISYKNNTKVGNASMTITFIGKYYGEDTVTLPFTIVKPIDYQVKNLKQTKVTATSFSLSWSKVTNAKYYKIEYSADGKKWSTDKTVSTNSATVTDYKKGTKVQFRVTALDKNKKALGKASAVLKTQTLCSAPTIKLTSTKSKTATVTITKVTGASKYTIYKSTDNKKWTKVGDTTKLSYSLTKLSGGKKIYVKAVAVNAYSKASAYSSVKSITVKK